MAVAMMDVWVVRMGVRQWLMRVRVGMRLTRRCV
jgi:hypothetical protein